MRERACQKFDRLICRLEQRSKSRKGYSFATFRAFFQGTHAVPLSEAQSRPDGLFPQRPEMGDFARHKGQLPRRWRDPTIEVKRPHNLYMSETRDSQTKITELRVRSTITLTGSHKSRSKIVTARKNKITDILWNSNWNVNGTVEKAKDSDNRRLKATIKRVAFGLLRPLSLFISLRHIANHYR